MKILVLAIALALSTSLNAQSNLSLNKTPINEEPGTAEALAEPVSTELTSQPGVENAEAGSDEYPVNKSLPDGIMLYRTKMVIVKDGVMKPLTGTVTLPNGTRVRQDGFVFQKNKYKMLLNLDEYVDASGKIRPIPAINTQIKQF